MYPSYIYVDVNRTKKNTLFECFFELALLPPRYRSLVDTSRLKMFAALLIFIRSASHFIVST